MHNVFEGARAMASMPSMGGCSFVAMMLFRIPEFDPDMIGTNPKDGLFRIYRDIRFSNDKTPYKI